MEGIRTSFSVLFLICVWTVLTNLSTAHQSHVIVTKQSVVPVPENKDDNRCMALLRRTVVRKELITYPCFHPVPGVVPVVAHQTQMGLVCRGYTNTPTTQYIRLPTCCPGFEPDTTGKCTQKLSQGKEYIPQQQYEQTEALPQQPETKRLEDLEEYPASYEKKRQQVLSDILSQPQHWTPHPMIMRRIDAILKERAHFLRQMQNDLTKGSQQPASQGVMISELFPAGPHHLLGQPGPIQQSIPQIPTPSDQGSNRNRIPQKQEHHHHHHHHHHQSGPPQIPNMPDAYHTALHKHNIPHTHDEQGNPQLHAVKQQQAQMSNDAFIKQQQEMQMAAKHQLNIKRQQQMYQLQQQRQQAIAMRQRMLNQRRMEQEQAQRHQQMMMQQARNEAQQSFRSIPFIPRQQMYQQTPAVKPFVIQRQYVSKDSLKQFPEIPRMRASVMLAVSPNMMQQHFFQQTVQSFPSIPVEQMMPFSGVQLPSIPVESPPVSVRPGPNSPYNLPAPPPCFAKYLMIVKRCFQDANIQIPNDHSMFNIDFNYEGVCQNREAIMACIFNNLLPCQTIQEHMLVKSTIGHTVDEMNRICQIGQIDGIEERMGGNDAPGNMPIIPNEMEQQPEEVKADPVQEIPIIPEDHHAMSLGQHRLNIAHGNEPIPEVNVVSEAQPKIEEPPKPQPEVAKPAMTISEHEDSQNVMSESHAHSHDEHDHVHEIVREQLKEDEYYLPILIGTAIGVAGIFVLLLAIVCICCRRRIKKKIYLQKETEKPKLFDVYTIGVPPPVYEMNGIPPISYEEAKGEKFTGSPSSVRRNNAENEYQQHVVRSMSGVVSDI